MTRNKEQVYDEQIAPLMTQIIAVCKEHKVPMLAEFFIPVEGIPDLKCTTSLLGGDYVAPQEMHDALGVLLADSSAPEPMMIKTVDADGGVTLTAVLG